MRWIALAIEEKDALRTRMRIIEERARGIEQMIEEDCYCIDIVQQINALSSAADGIGLTVLQNHIKGCINDAIREQRGDDHIEEIMDTIRKALKR